MPKKGPFEIKPKKIPLKIKPKNIPLKIKPKTSKNNENQAQIHTLKKMKLKKYQKNVSHTSKKCHLNVPPRKFLKPKTIFCKKFFECTSKKSP